MKGVVMLAAGYHPYVGGAEGQARTVAAALKKQGIAVQVLTRRMPGVLLEDTVDDVPVHRLAAWGPGPVASWVFMIASFSRLLADRDSYDVIHVHLASSPAVAAAAAGRLLGKRVLIKLGGGKGYGEIATSRRSVLGRLKLFALAALRPVLVSVNEDILAEVPGSGLEGLETAVIANGVDTERFKPASGAEKAALRASFGWGPGFTLLSASRLDIDKGVDRQLALFLETWAKTAAPDARLIVAGTGAAEAALREKAATLAAPADFLGVRRDLPELYRASDAFLLPSASEGLSNALLEALACGLPVLATRVTGIVDVIEDGVNGLLYAPGDTAELETALKRLQSDGALHERLSKAARATAQMYSLDRTIDRWLSLYQGQTPSNLGK